MRTGEPSTSFGVLLDGALAIHLDLPGQEPHIVEITEPGSIVGEIGMLMGRPHMATVTALVDSEVAVGDAGVFDAILHVPAAEARIRTLALRRLAADVTPLDKELRDGTVVHVRPLLPTDRDGIAAAVRAASAETLRRRFFSVAPPTSRVIDYLTDLNYVDHFAWLVTDESDAVVAVSRYVRDREDPCSAEVALTVLDDWQGKGLGRLILGAAGVAASASGIDTFTALFLAENRQVRELFRTAGAVFGFSGDPGAVMATMPLASVSALLDDQTATAIAGLARTVFTGRW